MPLDLQAVLTAKPYAPELGQAVFGAAYHSLECPEIIVAGIRHLAREIERVEWNLRQEVYEAPTSNNGESYSTDVFEMHAYYWGDCSDECEAQMETSGTHLPDCLVGRPNFKCGDFEVNWYKRLGRGTTMNRAIDLNEFAVLLDRCLASVRAKEKGVFWQ